MLLGEERKADVGATLHAQELACPCLSKLIPTGRLSRPPVVFANREGASGPAQRAWPAALRTMTARRHSVCRSDDRPSSSIALRDAISRVCCLRWRVKVSTQPRSFQVL